MRHLIYILGIFFLIASCKQETVSTDEALKDISVIDTLQIPSGKNAKPSLRLTQEAQKKIENWALYQDISTKLDSLNNQKTLGTLKKLLPRMVSLFENKKEAEAAAVAITPDAFTSPAIQARLLALETKIKVLNNAVQKNEPEAQIIADAVVDSKNAFQNLNLQINERFAVSIQDMLDALNEVPDSLAGNNSDVSNPTQLLQTQN